MLKLREKQNLNQNKSELFFKIIFNKQEVIAITCSWCKRSYHNKRSCFSLARFDDHCDRGALRELRLPTNSLETNSRLVLAKWHASLSHLARPSAISRVPPEYLLAIGLIPLPLREHPCHFASTPRNYFIFPSCILVDGLTVSEKAFWYNDFILNFYAEY